MRNHFLSTTRAASTEAGASTVPAAVASTEPAKTKTKKAATAKKAKAHKPSQIKSTDDNPAKSIVPVRFKEKYADHNDTNGDKVALTLKAATQGTNKDGRPCLDVKALDGVAKANGIDTKDYAHLNNGQKRMNVGNKLRGLLKAGKTITIGTTKFADAAKALAVQPPTEKKAKVAKAKKTAKAAAPAPQAQAA